ncbi:hypothetical protein DESC_740024 [Desulfosarcina cetonica]|uniref:hypothetical protein n=1 Tax=Desulfosarcina cetonica TaxID=90730 RepID=UPI0006D2B7AC|nr:hypothetical protein [Desulfosarcina cetonica]VTR69285.1 hypothetical protein DESC_740024 [Desulfosarcina cetonica]
MKTDPTTTWPIAVQETQSLTFLGLPQRLGNGMPPTRETYDRFPPLDAVAGDDWFARILSVLLPRTVVWAWWAPSRTRGLKAITAHTMPADIPLTTLTYAVKRRWLLHGRTLVMVPPALHEAQNQVLEWAGIDTERAPELLLAAPSSCRIWKSESIFSWCRNRTAWKDPSAVAEVPADRVVVMFDGDIYCALPASQAPAQLQALHALAATWGLEVIPGPMEHAWPSPEQPPQAGGNK